MCNTLFLQTNILEMSMNHSHTPTKEYSALISEDYNYRGAGIVTAFQIYVEITINYCLVWCNSSALVTSDPSSFCNDHREREM